MNAAFSSSGDKGRAQGHHSQKCTESSVLCEKYQKRMESHKEMRGWEEGCVRKWRKGGGGTWNSGKAWEAKAFLQGRGWRHREAGMGGGPEIGRASCRERVSSPV